MTNLYKNYKTTTLSLITLFTIIFTITNNAMQKSDNYFENAKIEDIKVEIQGYFGDLITKSYNLTCGDFEAKLDITINKSNTSETNIIFIPSKFDHKNDPFAHNIKILKEHEHLSIYMAEMLLYKFWYASEFWEKNNINKEDCKSIEEKISSLKILSTKPLKITEKTKKFFDLRISTQL